MRSASRGELRWEEEPAESLKRLSRGNVKLGLCWGRLGTRRRSLYSGMCGSEE